MATARFVGLAWVLLLVTPAIPTAAQQKKLTVTDQVVFGAYWTAEPGWHTEFQLRNNLLSGPLTVTPVLRLSNGQEYPLSPVTIPVSDLATVDVSQELANLASPLAEQAGTYGSAVFKRVDSTHNSLISVTNAGKKPTEAVLTFHYNHGQNEYEIRRTIAAGDQLWLNMGDLIRNQLPDIKGRTLPADLTSGTYEIREPGRNNDPSIFEGKIIVDKAYGHLAYGCTTCCGDGYPSMVAD